MPLQFGWTEPQHFIFVAFMSSNKAREESKLSTNNLCPTPSTPLILFLTVTCCCCFVKSSCHMCSLLCHKASKFFMSKHLCFLGILKDSLVYKQPLNESYMGGIQQLTLTR